MEFEGRLIVPWLCEIRSSNDFAVCIWEIFIYYLFYFIIIIIYIYRLTYFYYVTYE